MGQIEKNISETLSARRQLKMQFRLRVFTASLLLNPNIEISIYINTKLVFT